MASPEDEKKSAVIMASPEDEKKSAFIMASLDDEKSPPSSNLIGEQSGGKNIQVWVA